jgi:heme/copper-type cytochrome/quinol oxidase subunit 2
MFEKIKGVTLLMLLVPMFLFGCSGGGDVVKAEKLVGYNTERFADMEATGELINGVRVIEISAFQFDFAPELIIVNKGEKVKLIVTAEDVPHGFEIEGFDIPGYDINTKIRLGMPLELEFVADEKGVWEFICTIFCGFGHSDMTGTFVIR